MIKEHLANFNIAGFTFYEGAMCFEQLRIGKKLTLILDETNGFDPRAVAIYFKTKKLGFVPRSENRIIYKLLKVGLNCIEARIQMVDGTELPEGQVRVIVYLTNNYGNE